MKHFLAVVIAAVIVGFFLVGLYWLFDTFLLKLPMQFYAVLILLQLVHIRFSKEK